MDYSPIISEVFKLWWVIPILLVITIFKTPWYKGVLGESLVMLAGDLRLPEDKYCKLHNVILPTPDGTTQIDHIIVSQFGIFVLETKNMKGWIFGGEMLLVVFGSFFVLNLYAVVMSEANLATQDRLAVEAAKKALARKDAKRTSQRQRALSIRMREELVSK